MNAHFTHVSRPILTTIFRSIFDLKIRLISGHVFACLSDLPSLYQGYTKSSSLYPNSSPTRLAQNTQKSTLKTCRKNNSFPTLENRNVSRNFSLVSPADPTDPKNPTDPKISTDPKDLTNPLGPIFFRHFLAILLFLVCLFATLSLHSQSTEPFSTKKLELPSPSETVTEQIIRHKGFTVSYNCDWRIPNWVAYELTAAEAEGDEPRSSSFTIDPNLFFCQSATTADYTNSGYDRGHMAPAADMSWSKAAMSESFYLSNICPQNPALNRGAWKSLEAKVRRIAQEHGRVFVVCGPIVQDETATIGESRVVVPTAFFKVLLLVDGNEVNAIGFIFGNINCRYPTSYYAKSVDFVEDITGFDFFPTLPDPIETRVEAAYDFSKW